MRKFKYILVFGFLLLALSGCRVRLIDILSEPEAIHETLQTTAEPLPIEENPTEPEQEDPTDPTPDAPSDPTEPTEPDDPTEPDEPSEPTPEEPIEPELTEDPPTEEPPTELPTQPETLHEPTIEIVEPLQDAATDGQTPAGSGAPVLMDTPETAADPTVTIETPSPEAAGETTLEDQGEGTLGLILDHHTGVLSRGLGSLFECQRLYVYFEHLTDFHTVNHSSPLHALIIDSGGFNAAVRRGNDALTIDAAWLQRQNPSLIIRTVTSDILGRNVNDTTRAQALRGDILDRPGLEGVNAVINRRVLLLSEELLQSDEGRLIAKLHIAQAMYPTLFTDINITALYEEIAGVGGVDYTRGVFAFLS